MPPMETQTRSTSDGTSSRRKEPSLRLASDSMDAAQCAESQPARSLLRLPPSAKAILLSPDHPFPHHRLVGSLFPRTCSFRFLLQITKIKSVTFDYFSSLDRNGRRKDWPIVNQSVKFAIFSARIHVLRQIPEKRFIQFSAAEFARQPL